MKTLAALILLGVMYFEMEVLGGPLAILKPVVKHDNDDSHHSSKREPKDQGGKGQGIVGKVGSDLWGKDKSSGSDSEDGGGTTSAVPPNVGLSRPPVTTASAATTTITTTTTTVASTSSSGYFVGGSCGPGVPAYGQTLGCQSCSLQYICDPETDAVGTQPCDTGYCNLQTNACGTGC